MNSHITLLLCSCVVEGRAYRMAVPIGEVEKIVPEVSPATEVRLWFPWGDAAGWPRAWIVWRTSPPQATPVQAVHDVKTYPLSALARVPRLLHRWAAHSAVVAFVREGEQWLPLISRRHHRPQP